jgi:O-glycosyl hydrolase
MKSQTNNIDLVAKYNSIFTGFGITEIFIMNGEVYITSDYQLTSEMVETIEGEFGISERVLSVVNSSATEVTCLDVAKTLNIPSGTNMILEQLAANGLILRKVERNGTRKYSIAA